MTRTKAAPPAPPGGPNPLFLHEEALEQGVELLYLAERCFSAEIVRHLTGTALSATAHRALYFIARHPDLAVGQLRDCLGISKPNLARVVKQLVDAGLVEIRVSERDRRRRLLAPTEAGRDAIAQAARAQRRRIAQAFRAAGAGAVEGYRSVMRGLIDTRLRRMLPDDGPV